MSDGVTAAMPGSVQELFSVGQSGCDRDRGRQRFGCRFWPGSRLGRRRRGDRGRREEKLQATAESVCTAGVGCLSFPTDVTRPEDCSALVEAAVDRFGRVDILVKNAGVSHVAPATGKRPEDVRSVVDVNLFGAYWAAQACARVMSPGSSIVNASSMLGLVKSVLPQAAHAASKARLIGLTRDLSNQWCRRKGIRVNAIAPGFVDTDMTSEMSPATMEQFLATCSMGRVGNAAGDRRRGDLSGQPRIWLYHGFDHRRRPGDVGDGGIARGRIGIPLPWQGVDLRNLQPIT